jgi:hypothetical protein
MGRNGERLDEAARCYIGGCEARFTHTVTVQDGERTHSASFCPFHHTLFRLLFGKEVGYAAQTRRK